MFVLQQEMITTKLQLQEKLIITTQFRGLVTEHNIIIDLLHHMQQEHLT